MKNLRRCLMLLVTIMMVFSLVGCPANNDTPPTERRVLRVGMECAYAPNNWQEDAATDSNLPIENVPGFYAEGFDVQIAKVIGEKLNADIIIVKLAWGGLIEALNSGQIDLIIAGMADTEERKQSINFTVPYHYAEYVIVVNNDGNYTDATSLADFSGASILGQKDTVYDTVIDQIPGVDHLPGVESVPSMISRLDQKTADGLVMDREIATPYLETYTNFKMITFEEGNGFDIGFTGACVGVRKADTALMEEINAVLNGISQEQHDAMYKAAQDNMPS